MKQVKEQNRPAMWYRIGHWLFNDNWRYILDCVEQHCKYEHECYLTRRAQWGYTLKAIVCLILNRSTEDPSFMDSIAVAVYGVHAGNYEYGGEDWYEWRVGCGIFTNWWAYEEMNGYP
jgi:hypothetical protein